MTDEEKIARGLSDLLANVHLLSSRLKERSRTEYFYPGSLAPELLRRSDEVCDAVIEHARRAVDALGATAIAIAAAREEGARDMRERAANTCGTLAEGRLADGDAFDAAMICEASIRLLPLENKQ